MIGSSQLAPMLTCEASLSARSFLEAVPQTALSRSRREINTGIEVRSRMGFADLGFGRVAPQAIEGRDTERESRSADRGPQSGRPSSEYRSHCEV